MAKREKHAGRKRILEELSRAEEGHYLFWSRLAGGYEPKVSRLLIARMVVLRFVFGLMFTLKFLERHEKRVIDAYKKTVEELSGEDRTTLIRIIEDEEQHEKAFMDQIDERVVRYLSFIVLGLADAIVEIT
ncbi:MAG: rubrerythrin family protein, partial [Nitrososphaerales archaeon]